nr:hypothetical protein [Tanacetum cinerariifolium]
DLKAITTRSGVSYDGPQIPPPPSFILKVMENKPEVTKDTVHSTNNESTEDVQPPVVQIETPEIQISKPIAEPVLSPISAPRPDQRPLIPYPSRMQDQKLRDKANEQHEKFFQIFKDLNFNISFADALILMPKFSLSIKSLLTNKDKLYELARTPLNEHCSAVLLKTLPEKLGDPGKFLIPCDFSGKAECLALADLGASINLMPLFVWNKLSLPDLSPTYFDVDPRVLLILRRSFLKTERALIDVFEGELTLRVGKEAITFNLNQTSRYSANYNDMTAKRIDIIDMACEEYSDILLLEAFLNDDPSLPPPNQGNYLPEVRKELKICEAKSDKSSIDEPPEVKLKDLPPHLEYAFLEGDDKLPVIIAKDLSMEEKTALITVLKSHNPWVSPVDCVPKKGGFKVVENEDNELIPTRLVTERMLKRCEDTNLCLKWEKSHFMVKEGIVLDHKISKLEIEVDKAKVDVITKLPHPTIVKGIRSFLVHAGFYQRFIKDFSKIARPMTQLLEKDTPFIFSKECVEAFQTLKRKLTEAPILIAPDWDMSFELICDASDFAIGAILGQRQDNHFRPIHYASKTMTETESNYTTTEKEMLVVVKDDDNNDDDIDDITNDDDDDVDRDADGDNEACDSERTDSDEDENPTLNQNDDEEEEYEEYMVKKGKKMQKRLMLVMMVKTKVPLQRSSISSDFATQFLNLDKPSPVDTKINSMMNIDVCHEEPSTQTSPLLTIPITVILETSTAAASTIPLTIPPINPLSQQSIPTPALTTETTTTSIPELLDFSSLFGFDQRVYVLENELSQLKQMDYSAQLLETIKSQIPTTIDDQLSTRLEDFIQKAFRSYTAEFKKKAQGEKKRYIDIIKKSVKDIIKDEVKSQLPQILPKEVSDYATSPKSPGKSAQAEESVFETADTEMPQNQGSDLGNTDDQPNVESALERDWFKKPKRPLTPDYD